MPSPAAAPARDTWLAGLVACGLAAEAGVVRAGLSARGLRTRSVPAGAAVSAWTCAAGGSTIAVVVSGRGPAAARRAAAFWAPRAATVIVTGAAAATGLVDAPAVLLEGDGSAAAAARAHATRHGLAVAEGRIATVSAPTLSAAGLASLAAAGYAAADSEAQPWREAAIALGIPVLVCRGLLAGEPVPDIDLLTPPGRASRSWWRTVLRLAARGGVGDRLRRHDQALVGAARDAGGCAIATLLGPG